MTTLLEATYAEFKKIPKGEWILRPDELIDTGFTLHVEVAQIIGSGQKVYFTRKSLKHLSEKGERGDILLQMIRQILESPEELRKRIPENRFIVTKSYRKDIRVKFYAIVLEVMNDKNSLIITSFIAKPKYLANSDLLWRTDASQKRGPSICISPK